MFLYDRKKAVRGIRLDTGGWELGRGARGRGRSGFGPNNGLSVLLPVGLLEPDPVFLQLLEQGGFCDSKFAGGARLVPLLPG